MRNLTILFSLILFSALSLSAQILEPVEWTWKSKHLGANEFELIYTADIDDGWAVYSQYLESDDGPVKTSFEYDKGSHFELLGKNVETGNKKESFDQVFQMNLIKFKKKGIFTQKIKVSDYSKPITGYLTFMTCDDTRCLPPTDVDFDFKLEAPSKGMDTKEKTSKTEAPKVAEKADETGDEIAEKEAESLEEKPAPSSGKGEGGFQDPVSWTFSGKKVADNKYELVYKGEIIDGWYVYSQHQESDDGPLATTFEYDPGDNYKVLGVAKESGGLKKAYDKVFEMNVNKFIKEAIFTQELEITDPGQPLTGYFTFQTCDDKSCKKYDIDFYADLSKEQFVLGSEAMKLTDALKNPGGTDIAAGNGDVTSAGPRLVGNKIDQVVPTIRETFNNPIGSCGGKSQKESNWFWAFVFGFGGGLLALLTPCVFPMIPLTVSFFTKGSDTRSKGIRNGLIYGLSIIVIYVGLGLLITIPFGPEALNRLSVHWLANMIFFTVFIIFAISFFGYFEITLPSSLANRSDQMADKGGFLGIFFMAATLAIVSFSCTGPIIGTALVQAASSGGIAGAFSVMLGFSSALALPFGLFAAFPAWLNTLPRSGSWMTNVKVVLGFLELALAFKFFSVADYTFQWGILKYELFVALWILIAAAMTLYLFGFIRFPHDSKLTKLSPVRWAFALGSLALTIYLCTGFSYSNELKSYTPPALLSGLAPPAGYNFFLEKPTVDPSLKDRFPSLTKCANDLDCFKDYYEGLSYAKETNQPILLDFTGYGCVNCRKTEDFIWSERPVRKNIEDNFVLISLYVDDPKELKDMLVSASREKKIRNVGNKWADFQIVNFEGNAQPLYVMMSPDESVLAFPRGYEEGWESYNSFLNCGLKTYNEYKTQLGAK